MPLANPRLGEPMPDRPLDRLDLEERIHNLLSTQNMCVLATSGPRGLLATPIRFFALDFAAMFTASPRSPKMRNIESDARASIGVFAPLVGLASSRGVQIFGEAVIVPHGDERFDHYWAACRWESEQVEQGRSPDDSPGAEVVVEATRMVYTEHWLRKSGYAARQFWSAD